MALRVPELPAGDWIYEMKFDGYRALAFKAGSEVRLLSRNRTLFNDNYPRLVDSRKALKAKGFIIDGRLGTSEPIPKSTQPDCSFRLLRVISQKCHVLTR
jgi:ATP-dependent DNA ligase